MKNIFMFFIILFFELQLIAKTNIVFFSAPKTSSYFLMAEDIGKIVKPKSSYQINIQVIESLGSLQNIKELEQRDKSKFIFTSPSRLIKNTNAKNIKLLFPIPPATMQFVVTSDSNLTKFDDLVGRTLLTGEGTYGSKIAKKYINLFGLEKKIYALELSFNNALVALKNREIDSFLTLSPFPATNVMSISHYLGINILNLSNEQISLTKDNKIIIPKNTYKGMKQDIQTTTFPIGVYASGQMNEEMAYKITKYFWESKTHLEKLHVWWKYISYADLKMFKTPLHKGAIRYYKESRVKLSKELIGN